MTTSAATAVAAGPAVPRWLAAVVLVLLVLPFDPHWLDFEQVRRGALLVLAGVVLIGAPALRPVLAERWLLWFVGALTVSGAIAWAGDVWLREPGTVATFQPWDAAYRLAHWLALVVMLRLGAASRAIGGVFAALLALTSAFGLLQHLGVAELAGYGVEREPVSVFGNLNVASEWTAVAAAVVACTWPGFPAGWPRRLAVAALLLGGAYLVVNGSRSGLVALPLGLTLLAVLRRREHGFVPLVPVAVGAAIGVVLTTLAAAGPAAGGLPGRRANDRAAATVEVRLEIAKGTVQLLARSPVTGLGPGQFAVSYPQVRTAREIELSSHDRQFPTEVRTAHDDWLELLVDGGLVGLAAFAIALLALQRAQRDKPALVPLFVLLVLMLARAPLWNAPAAVAALWLAGVPDLRTASARAARVQRVLALATGVTLLGLGVPVLVGNQYAAAWQRAVARTEQPDPGALTAAVAWLPFEPRLLQLLSQERLFANDLAGATDAARRAQRLRPHDPQLDVHVGEALARSSRFDEALGVAQRGLTIDPPNPELRVLASAVLAQQGRADAAIAAVAVDPHPVLRAQLAHHFHALAQLARSRGHDDAAARFTVEHHFVAAVDRLGDDSPDGLTARSEHIAGMTAAMERAGRDARPLLLGALALVDAGDPARAVTLGEAAQRFAPLAPWQRTLLAPWLERLLPIDAWRSFLAPR